MLATMTKATDMHLIFVLTALPWHMDGTAGSRGSLSRADAAASADGAFVSRSSNHLK